MSIAKILVPVTGTKRDTVALRTAFAAAKVFGAHVEAMFVHPDPRETIPYVGVPLSPQVIQDVIDAADEIAKAASKAARGNLATTAEEAQVRIVARAEKSEGPTASYVEQTGHFSAALEAAALLTDLIVFPPTGHGDNPDMHEGLVRVLTRSGRPILLSPDDAGATLGKKVSIGWDGGLAAAHALTASLPFLKKAQSVQILTFARAKERGADAEAVKTYLALHGVKATAQAFDPGTRGVSELLPAAAMQSGCDLLVIGGYGHSHALETVFGGVTQRIVSQPRLPVFMMH